MFENVYNRYMLFRMRQRDIANIKGKCAVCDLKPLSDAQKSEIQQFYQKLAGQKVPTYWHEYFYSRNGQFSVRYIPTSLYHTDVIYRLNTFQLRHAYVDKGIYDIYFPDVNRPSTVIKNMNGYFYDSRKSISRAEALERCQNLGRVVIKPTQEGMWGEGVKVFSVEQGIVEEGLSIEQLLEKYGKNFIIQEAVAQHPEMAKLNPTSLNTLRVLSYRQGDEVFILYVVVRIGRAGKSVDNETAGGINADIDLATGTIRDCAYGTPSEKRILTTDVGTTLKGFAIPSFQQVLETVKDMHLRLPYFNLIGWDFGIDENGLPVMIEWNRAPDLSQTAHGPAFGEMTETIFERIRHLKNTMLR